MLAGATPVLVHNTGNGPSGTIFRSGDYIFQIYANDHPDPQGHLKGKGYNIQIGQNGKPLPGNPELTSAQQEIVDANKGLIRRSTGKKMAEYNRNHPKDPATGERC